MKATLSRLALVLIFSIVTVGAAVAWSAQSGGHEVQGYENVGPGKAAKIIEESNPLVLDVRTPDEFENGHIPNAILVPVDELENSTILELSKGKQILCYCRSGHRSSWAAEYLSRQGYDRSYNLSGGILAWENEGYPVVEARDVENKPKCSCVVLENG